MGTAFGVSQQQRIADVLVSESVFLYDDRHVVDGEVGRLSAAVESLSGFADRFTYNRWISRRPGAGPRTS